MRKWRCKKCKYVYDPAVGDPKHGIPADTPFEQLPPNWKCPLCGAPKSDFEPL
ncbi:MAG: rubredoxin [Tidjanibacter sp.]|nr:rubredoxin [Tidjanibacter sp.]MBQ3070685.1 rubredoxin [Tidjanibacter sp.]MBR1958541.1 rubredoxin [Tidjanibacter sp.]MBR3931967.1 rubredoxin [Tidjanibacter sp.]